MSAECVWDVACAPVVFTTSIPTTTFQWIVRILFVDTLLHHYLTDLLVWNKPTPSKILIGFTFDLHFCCNIIFKRSVI